MSEAMSFGNIVNSLRAVRSDYNEQLKSVPQYDAFLLVESSTRKVADTLQGIVNSAAPSMAGEVVAALEMAKSKFREHLTSVPEYRALLAIDKLISDVAADLGVQSKPQAAAPVMESEQPAADLTVASQAEPAQVNLEETVAQAETAAQEPTHVATAAPAEVAEHAPVHSDIVAQTETAAEPLHADTVAQAELAVLPSEHREVASPPEAAENAPMHSDIIAQTEAVVEPAHADAVAVAQAEPGVLPSEHQEAASPPPVAEHAPAQPDEAVAQAPAEHPTPPVQSETFGHEAEKAA